MQKAQGTSRCPGEYLNPSRASEWFGRDDPRPRPRGRKPRGRRLNKGGAVGKGKVGGGLQVAETLRMRPVWQGSWAVMRSMEGRVRTGALTAYEVS